MFLVLLAGGIVAVAYGARRHTVAVVCQAVEEREVEEEVTKTIQVPNDAPDAEPAPGELPPPAENMPPGETPPAQGQETPPSGESPPAQGEQAPQAALFKSVKVKVLETTMKPVQVEKTLSESEPTLIREMTVGGVVRLATGVLHRTYGEGVEPPSLCPT